MLYSFGRLRIVLCHMLVFNDAGRLSKRMCIYAQVGAGLVT